MDRSGALNQAATTLGGAAAEAAAVVARGGDAVPPEVAGRVFAALSTVNARLEHTPPERPEVRATQQSLEAALAMIMEASPGVRVAEMAGQAYALAFEAGTPAALFDVFRSWLAIVGAKNAPPATKVAILRAAAVVADSAGRQCMPLFGDASTALLRAIKSSSSTPAVKAGCMTTLASLVRALGSAGSNAHSDILKAVKSALSDKSAKVQAGGCHLAGALAFATTVPKTFDSVVALLLKSFNSRATTPLLRRAFGVAFRDVINGAVANAPSPGGGGDAGPSSSGGGGAGDAGDGSGEGGTTLGSAGVAAAAPGAVLMASLEYGIGRVMGVFGSGGTELMTAVTQGMLSALEAIDDGDLRLVAWPMIEFLLRLVANPGATLADPSTLPCAVACVGHLVRHGVLRRLDEDEQLSAVRNLVGAAGAADASGASAVEVILGELVWLVEAVGAAVAPLAEDIEDGLVALMAAPSEDVRIRAARVFQALAVVLPERIGAMAMKGLAGVKRAGAEGDGAGLLGASAWLAGVVSVARSHREQVHATLLQSCFDTAVGLLGDDGAAGGAGSRGEEAAWTMLCGLGSLGTVWVRAWWDPFQALFVRMAAEADAASARAHYTSVAHTLNAFYAIALTCGDLWADEEVLRFAVSLLTNLLTAFSKEKGGVAALSPVLKDKIKTRLLQIALCLPIAYFKSCYVPLASMAAKTLTSPGEGEVAASYLHAALLAEDIVLTPAEEEEDAGLEALNLPDAHAPRLSPESLWNGAYVGVEGGRVEQPRPVQKIDAAILVFGKVFPLLKDKNKRQLVAFLGSAVAGAGEKEAAAVEAQRSRKKAVVANAAAVYQAAVNMETNIFVAFATALRVCVSSRRALAADIAGALYPLLGAAIVHSHAPIRRLAGQALGSFADLADDATLASVINDVLGGFRTSGDAVHLSGRSFALGCIHRAVGGIRSSVYLEPTVNVLFQLATQKGTALWATHALRLTIDATALQYYAFVETTAGLMVAVLLHDSLDKPAVREAVGETVKALMATLGPELRTRSERTLFLALATHLLASPVDNERLQGIFCMQELLVADPSYVDVDVLVPELLAGLASPLSKVRAAAAKCFRQLAQWNAEAVGDPSLTVDILGVIDREGNGVVAEDLRIAIQFIVDAHSPANRPRWLKLFRSVVLGQRPALAASGTGDGGPAAAGGADGAPEAAVDDSANMLGGDAGGDDGAPGAVPRWRSRVVAARCFLRILQTAEDDASLVPLIDGLVQTAFNAASSQVEMLRPVGLAMATRILALFGAVPDPAVEGGFLLELSQAQLFSSIRSAFDDASVPTLRGAALAALASYLSSPFIRDAKQCGRGLRLLASMLDRFDELDFAPFGEAVATAVRVGLLRTYAVLFLDAPVAGPAVTDLVGPSLAGRWVAALRDAFVVGLADASPAHAEYQPAFYAAKDRSLVARVYAEAKVALLGGVGKALELGLISDTLMDADAYGLVFGVCCQELARLSVAGSGSGGEGGGAAVEWALTGLRGLIARPFLERHVDQGMLEQLLTSLGRAPEAAGAAVSLAVARLASELWPAYFDGSMNDSQTLMLLLELVSAALLRDDAPDQVLATSLVTVGTVAASFPASLLPLHLPVMLTMVLDAVSLHAERGPVVEAGVKAMTALTSVVAAESDDDCLAFVHAAAREICRGFDASAGAVAPLASAQLQLLAPLALSSAAAPAPSVHAAIVEAIKQGLESPHAAVRGRAMGTARSLAQLGLSQAAGSTAEATLRAYLSSLLAPTVTLLRGAAHPSASVPDADDADSKLAVSEGINLLLVLFKAANGNGEAAAAMALMVPVLVSLLDPDAPAQGHAHQTALTTLNSLGAAAADAFRAEAARLPASAMKRLQDSLVQQASAAAAPSRSSTSAPKTVGGGKPKIQLKSFGGK